MREIISFIGGLLGGVALFPYIYGIYKKKVRPSKAAWIVFAVLDTVTALGMYFDGKLNLQIASAGGCAIIIMIMSFFYGISGWTRLERFCIVGATVGFFVLLINKNPLWSILISQSVAFIGATPIFTAAWKGVEDKVTWTIFFSSCVLTITTLKGYSLGFVAQPVNFLLMGGIMVGFLYFRNHRDFLAALKERIQYAEADLSEEQRKEMLCVGDYIVMPTKTFLQWNGEFLSKKRIIKEENIRVRIQKILPVEMNFPSMYIPTAVRMMIIVQGGGVKKKIEASLFFNYDKLHN